MMKAQKLLYGIIVLAFTGLVAAGAYATPDNSNSCEEAWYRTLGDWTGLHTVKESDDIEDWFYWETTSSGKFKFEFNNSSNHPINVTIYNGASCDDKTVAYLLDGHSAYYTVPASTYNHRRFACVSAGYIYARIVPFGATDDLAYNHVGYFYPNPARPASSPSATPDPPTSGQDYSIGWDVVSGTDYYELQEHGTVGWQTVYSGPNTSFIRNNPQGTYFYHVRACNDDCGCGPWSQESIVTVKGGDGDVPPSAENEWIQAEAFNSHDNLFSLQEIGDGLILKLWSRIDVGDCNSACEYSNNAGVDFVAVAANASGPCKHSDFSFDGQASVAQWVMGAFENMVQTGGIEETHVWSWDGYQWIPEPEDMSARAKAFRSVPESFQCHSDPAQWIEWTTNVTSFNWFIRQPGMYAAQAATITLTSNEAVSVDYSGFGNLEPVDGTGDAIPVWYATGIAEGGGPPHIVDFFVLPENPTVGDVITVGGRLVDDEGNTLLTTFGCHDAIGRVSRMLENTMSGFSFSTSTTDMGLYAIDFFYGDEVINTLVIPVTGLETDTLEVVTDQFGYQSGYTEGSPTPMTVAMSRRTPDTYLQAPDPNQIAEESKEVSSIWGALLQGAVNEGTVGSWMITGGICAFSLLVPAASPVCVKLAISSTAGTVGSAAVNVIHYAIDHSDWSESKRDRWHRGTAAVLGGLKFSFGIFGLGVGTSPDAVTGILDVSQGTSEIFDTENITAVEITELEDFSPDSAGLICVSAVKDDGVVLQLSLALQPPDDQLSIKGHSPIDLVVIDPYGRSCGSNGCNIPNATYVVEYSDGDRSPQVLIHYRPPGEYQVQAIPTADADPSDTYSISITDNMVTVWAVIDQVIGIGEQPVLPYQAPSFYRVRLSFIPSSWSFGLNGELQGIIHNLPEDYSVSDIHSNSVLLNGKLSIEGELQLDDSYPDIDGPVAIATFDRQAAVQSLGDYPQPGEYDVLITGEFSDGNKFAAEATITLEEGAGYASLSGRVSANGSEGLAGVTIDVYDSGGTLWRSLVTDNSGCYSADEVPNGDYSVTLVKPIGYQADEETKQTTIYHVPVTVGFSLHRLEMVPSQRSMGYWKHQVNVHLSGKGHAQESLADMSNYMSLIGEHFNNNLANPITIFEVPQPANQTDSLEVLQYLLTVNVDGTMNDRAKQQLIALMLNVVSLKLHQATAISEDSATVSQAITYCNQLIIDADESNDETAKDVADQINNGVLIASGVIALTTPNIAYKGGEDQITQTLSVPKEFSLEQNYPNPFNPICEIAYTLPTDCEVKLTIYNILGQKVRVLVDENQSAGHKLVEWDGNNDQGKEVTSGVYFYRIEAGDFAQSKRMVLLK